MTANYELTAVVAYREQFVNCRRQPPSGSAIDNKLLGRYTLAGTVTVNCTYPSAVPPRQSFQGTLRSFGKVLLIAGALACLALAADNAREGHLDSVCFYLGLGCVLVSLAFSRYSKLRLINRTLPAVYQETHAASSRWGRAEKIFGLSGLVLLVVSIFLGYLLA